MANFNSINRAAAFNPTSAFPLDARCYFENLNEAITAAESAEAAGSSNTVYYFGQTLVVVDFEKNDADLYLIVKDSETGKGSLKAVGQKELTEADLTAMLKAVLTDASGNALLDDNGKIQLKTINGESIIGSGNITITSEGKITVDGELSIESENPVQNKVITAAINELADKYLIVETENERIQLTNKSEGKHVYVKESKETYFWTGAQWTSNVSQTNIISILSNTDVFSQLFDPDYFELVNNKISLVIEEEVKQGSKKAVSSGAVYDYIEETVGNINDALSEI